MLLPFKERYYLIFVSPQSILFKIIRPLLKYMFNGKLFNYDDSLKEDQVYLNME